MTLIIKTFIVLVVLLYCNTVQATDDYDDTITNNTSVSVSSSVNCSQAPCLTVQTSLQSLSQALNKGSDYKKLVKLIRLYILNNFDFMMIVKYSLGEYNSTISDAKKQEIAKLFKEMLISAYTNQLYKFNHTKIKIVHSNIDDDNPNIASVICSVKFNNQTSAVTVEYLLNKSKNGWKIYDVTIDDISVLSSFRIVFENVISSEGVEGLIMLLHSNELAEQIDQTINNHPDI